MSKIIAAINMTLDGICDHEKGVPDEEIHDHYTCLLNNSDLILYGRKTYQLMEFWPPLLIKPSGQRSMDEFAFAIDKIQKIVFSNTLKTLTWKTASLAQKSLEEEIKALKQKEGKDVLIGSRSLIVQLLNTRLIDEFQICIHPLIAGVGLPLFEHINPDMKLKLISNSVFQKSGAVLVKYGII